MGETKIVVLGAGVVGLTTAMQLSKNNDYSVTIVAKHMPGDYDIEYASPWAGANYLPVGVPGSNLAEYEKNTWPELQRLAANVPEAHIHFQETVLHNRKKDGGTTTGNWFNELLKTDPWFKDVVPNFRVLPQGQLGPGIDSATAFTSVCINTALYLPWLTGQCRKHGAQLRRGIVSHVADAAALHHSGQRADIVVNCTGLGSLKLGGVQDTNMYPGRGQIVLVRNTPGVMTSSSGTDDGEDEAVYIMQRADGGGTILGGCLQRHSWESQPDPNLAVRIMKRAVELCPALTDGKGIEALSIIRHGVGLRPMREGGPRVDKERIEGVWTVHNYGHGGYGYQASYGSADAAVKLVDEIAKTKAKL
ncbi:FAD dependent oxidoreductase [Macrophomina phaseolina MS6]|uniref:D-amino-acid oxidase n=1 Tax=Macrophomina phaseolina (strain MS6) TaxID=1126212 RepID=K2RPR8_MACPH|nr:FAD dependent oxidoreductase [Macrophomina phaseolina MS6]